MTAQQLEVIRQRHADVLSWRFDADEVTVTAAMVGESLLVLKTPWGSCLHAGDSAFATYAHKDVADLLNYIDDLTAKLDKARKALGD